MKIAFELDRRVEYDLFATAALADNPMIGGAAMDLKKNIVDNAVSSRTKPLSLEL